MPKEHTKRRIWSRLRDRIAAKENKIDYLLRAFPIVMILGSCACRYRASSVFVSSYFGVHLYL